MHRILGTPTLNPILFWSGKISGYIVWSAFFVQFKHNLHHFELNIPTKNLSLVIFAIGLMIAFVSIIQLGNSTTAGIPKHDTKLKYHGIYKFSRNPMYIGFHIMCIASVLFTQNIFVLILTVYSIWVYHKIILGEEQFLKNRFGTEYNSFCQKVNRYF